MKMKQCLNVGLVALGFALVVPGCDQGSAPVKPATPASGGPSAPADAPKATGAAAGSTHSGSADVAPPAGEKK